MWGTLEDRLKPAPDLVVGRVTLPHKDSRGHCVPEGRRGREGQDIEGCFRHKEGGRNTCILVVGMVVVE